MDQNNKVVRQNTKLEAEGAEFLVLGHLLIEGILAFKAYINFPGYDLIATNPEKNILCRLQVKSRWATDSDNGFPIKNFDCDFVVFVALNRGYKYTKKGTVENNYGRKAPDIYIFPVETVRQAQNPHSSWGKAFLKNILGVDEFKENWNLIKNFLCMNNTDVSNTYDE